MTGTLSILINDENFETIAERWVEAMDRCLTFISMTSSDIDVTEARNAVDACRTKPVDPAARQHAHDLYYAVVQLWKHRVA